MTASHELSLVQDDRRRPWLGSAAYFLDYLKSASSPEKLVYCVDDKQEKAPLE